MTLTCEAGAPVEASPERVFRHRQTQGVETRVDFRFRRGQVAHCSPDTGQGHQWRARARECVQVRASTCARARACVYVCVRTNEQEPGTKLVMTVSSTAEISLSPLQETTCGKDTKTVF